MFSKDVFNSRDVIAELGDKYCIRVTFYCFGFSVGVSCVEGYVLDFIQDVIFLVASLSELMRMCGQKSCKA